MLTVVNAQCSRKVIYFGFFCIIVTPIVHLFICSSLELWHKQFNALKLYATEQLMQSGPLAPPCVNFSETYNSLCIESYLFLSASHRVR